MSKYHYQVNQQNTAALAARRVGLVLAETTKRFTPCMIMEEEKEEKDNFSISYNAVSFNDVSRQDDYLKYYQQKLNRYYGEPKQYKKR